MLRSTLVVLLLSFLSLSLLSSSSAAVCGGAGYDLSSITNTDLSWNDTAKAYNWYLRPCGNVSAAGCQQLETTTAGGVMMCQLPYSGPPGYSIATWVPESTQFQTTWNAFGGNSAVHGVRMQLSDGAMCGSSPRRLTVNYICDASRTQAVMTNVNETQTCNYVATVYTAAACNQPTTNGQCGTNGLNLNSLTTTDLVYQDVAKNYTYYFRPCGVVTSTQCSQSPYGDVAGEAMMCQATGLYGEMSQNTYNLAWWNPSLAVWRRFTNPQYNAAGYTMTIQDGTSCGSFGNRELTVWWICSASDTTPRFAGLNETSTCNYQAYVFTSLACNAAPITTTEGCGGHYDLTFASQRDLVYTVPNAHDYYVLRPCGIVDNARCQANGNTNQSMLCQAYTDQSNTNDIAIWNPTAVSYTPTLTGLSMFIQDGDVCGSLGPRSLTINFVCQQGPPNTIAFTNFQEPSTCQYVATVTTSAVCSNRGRPNGLCGAQGYDFSLANGQDWAYVSPSGSYTYYFNPCGQVNNAQCNYNGATKSSMMCQAVNGAQTTYDIAYYDYNLVAWYKTSFGMQMFVQDGQSCNINGQVYDRALTVNFVCGSSPLFNNLTESSTTPCSYTAYVTTPQACAPVSNGGSTGISLPAQSSGGYDYEKITKCGGVYDLSSLSTYDLTYYPPNQEYKWVLRVCGAVSSDTNCTTAEANTPGGWMLCQDSQYGYGSYEASTWNPYQAQWTPTRNGVILTMADGSGCGSGVRTTRVYFTCDSSATTASIYNITEAPQCTYNVYVKTNLVCPTGSQVCGGAGYDVSSLSGKGDLSIVSGGYTWFFNPCGVVQNSQCQADALAQSSMVCQASTGGTAAYNVAVWVPQVTTWTSLGSSVGVKMTVQDGSTCTGYDFERLFTAYFLCGLSGSYSIINITEPTVCNYQMFINTGLSCAQMTGTPGTPSGTPVVVPSSSGAANGGGGVSDSGSSSSLSGGAIAGIVIGCVVGALIILAVLLVVCCGLGGRGKGKTDYGNESEGRTSGKYGEMEPSQQSHASNDVEMETA